MDGKRNSLFKKKILSSTDISEIGRYLHRFGDSHAHSRMDGSGRMYGSLDRYSVDAMDDFELLHHEGATFTIQHAFHKDGLRPDIIGARPDLYLRNVQGLESVIREKFNLNGGIRIGLFQHLTEWAAAHYDNENPAAGSLIGIINYYVAQENGKKTFELQFAREYAEVEDYKTHEQHIKNTELYLNSQGIKYKKENYYSTHHYGGSSSDTYQMYRGVRFTILD